MGSASLYKPRPVSPLYRRERELNFNPKFYKDAEGETGNLRVCWECEQRVLVPKKPDKEPEK